MRRTLLAAGAALAAIALAAAPRTVTDDSGHEVVVGTPPLRIVSLSPGGTETLFAAGAGAQVIATVEYSDEPLAARAVPRIGDAAAIDLERLLALRPDVIVAWPGGGNPAQRARIAGLGIPVYEQEVERLASLPASVRRLGALAGTGPVAERSAKDMEARLASLRETYGAGTGRRPSVLLQIWDRPIYTVGGEHLMSDALALCGTRNVFEDLREASPVVSTEAVIERNPDIIIAAGPPGEGAHWLADWKRFPSLAAVRNGRLVAFDDQALSRLGPSVIAATGELCRTLAPLTRGSY